MNVQPMQPSIVASAAPLPHTIRLATEADLPFIRHSWLTAVKHQYPNQHALDFPAHHRAHMDRVMSHSLAITAHLPDEPDSILAYLIYQQWRGSLIAHHAYTKLDARQQGLLTSLLTFANPARLPVFFTAAAKNEALMRHFAARWIFAPHLLSLDLS